MMTIGQYGNVEVFVSRLATSFIIDSSVVLHWLVKLCSYHVHMTTSLNMLIWTQLCKSNKEIISRDSVIVKIDICKYSFYPRTIRTWNNLPLPTIPDSLDKFKAAVFKM